MIEISAVRHTSCETTQKKMIVLISDGPPLYVDLQASVILIYYSCPEHAFREVLQASLKT